MTITENVLLVDIDSKYDMKDFSAFESRLARASMSPNASV
jgi:hypothetical protein